MRQVEELYDHGFHPMGYAWEREDCALGIGNGFFQIRLSIRSHDDVSWDEVYAILCDPTTQSPYLWWRFDLNGMEIESGGEVADLLAASGLGHGDAERAVYDARTAAAQAIEHLTQALAH